jgi:hypothetical protein
MEGLLVWPPSPSIKPSNERCIELFSFYSASCNVSSGLFPCLQQHKASPLQAAPLSWLQYPSYYDCLPPDTFPSKQVSATFFQHIQTTYATSDCMMHTHPAAPYFPVYGGPEGHDPLPPRYLFLIHVFNSNSASFRNVMYHTAAMLELEGDQNQSCPENREYIFRHSTHQSIQFSCTPSEWIVDADSCFNGLKVDGTMGPFYSSSIDF